MRKMLIAFILLTVALLAFAGFVDQRATTREALLDARFPPIGELIEVDGQRVHVIVKGTGPDLVLIHGAGGNARDFDYKLLDRLAERYRVFAVDRPGLGWSDPISQAASPMEQARHLAQATRQLGAKNPIILGHSYGGAVAMAWGLEEPASALVIVSGATMPWPGPLRNYYRVFGSRLGGWAGAALVAAFVTDQQVSTSVKSVFAPAKVPQDYVEGAAIPLATRRTTFQESAAQVKALRPEVVEMSSDYGLINLPVEILHGTEDTTVWADIHAIPLSKLLPNANLTLMDGVGHAPHHVEPDTVVHAIDRAATRAGLH